MAMTGHPGAQRRSRTWRSAPGSSSSNGMVMRLREEDLKERRLARVTTWSPATVKSLAPAQKQGWTYSVHHPRGDAAGRRHRGGAGEDVRVARARGERDRHRARRAPSPTPSSVQRDRPDKEGKVRIYWLVPGVGKVKEDGERLEELVVHDIKK